MILCVISGYSLQVAIGHKILIDALMKLHMTASRRDLCGSSVPMI